MPRVIILTSAYNAKKTLPRTIQSILSQTVRDWVWILVDSGSEDSTGEIMRDLARRDSRVIYRRNQTNNMTTGIVDSGNSIVEILAPYDDDDYYCSIDADDEYKPEFLEKMVHFTKLHRLDVAICGNDFVDAATHRLLSVRSLSQDLILDEENTISENFYFFHQFSRTQWGKLWKLRYIRDFDYNVLRKIGYGGDTLLCLTIFSAAKRIGVLGESLHRYYVSPKSTSYHFDSRRIASDRILFETARDFLIDKCGKVSPQNWDVLFAVYLNALIDTSHVLLSAKIDLEQKLDHLREMMDCMYTRQLAARENFGDVLVVGSELRERRKAHFRAVTDWLLTLQEVPDEQVESFCDMGEFASAAAEHAEGWVFFNKLRIRLLIDQGRAEEACAKLNEFEEVLPGDTDLEAFRAQLLGEQG